MGFAIVVLNYNDRKNTINYVNSIKDYNTVNKIIVVDNNSTVSNEVKELNILASEKVEIISSQSNGGYASGNNIGLKYLEKIGNYEFVAISNPDVAVEEETLIKCIEHLKTNKKVSIVTPRMHFVNGPARRAAWKKRTVLVDIANSTRITEFLMYFIQRAGEYTKKDYSKSVLNVENVAGSFFIAKYDSLKKIGYLDENTFLFYEEDILGHKIKNIGNDIHILNELKFMHYDSQTIGKMMNMFKKLDILFDSKIYYHKKYNNANGFQICIFKALRIVRKVELLIEVPIRKLYQVIKNKK